MMEKLLILDLDETLIHAREEPLAHAADFLFDRYHVYARPYLRQFLERVADVFRIAIWTSAGAQYAAAVVSRIIPEGIAPEFVWSRERCTLRYDHESGEHYFRKDLSKVKRRGYSLAGVLVVDDTPRKLEASYGNLVPIVPFAGSPDDDLLPNLGAYLVSLRHIEDVRPIEKRYWRHESGHDQC